MTNLPSKVRAIKDELNGYFLERHEAIDAMIMALLAKEHGFMLGPPGTAKSQLIRSLTGHITGAAYFETVLSRIRPAEAVLGPWSLARLRTDDVFVRNTTSYLPEANIAFLDEIGKMSAALGHDLLSVLNERRLHQVADGQAWVDVPLYTAFAGSNELPTAESDDAAALWDRLLVRISVDYIQEEASFARLLDLGDYHPKTTIVWTELATAIDKEIQQVTLPTDVREAIVALRRGLAEAGVRPSDRRWLRSTRLVKAQAWLGERPEATIEDLVVLQHSLWDGPEQRDVTARSVLKLADPAAEELSKIRDACTQISAEMDKRMGRAIEERSQFAIEINPKVRGFVTDLKNKRESALKAGRSTTQLDKTITIVNQVRYRMYVDMMDLPKDKVQAE